MGEEQAAKAPPSSLHSNVEPASLDAKANVALIFASIAAVLAGFAALNLMQFGRHVVAIGANMGQQTAILRYWPEDSVGGRADKALAAGDKHHRHVPQRLGEAPTEVVTP